MLWPTAQVNLTTFEGPSTMSRCARYPAEFEPSADKLVGMQMLAGTTARPAARSIWTAATPRHCFNARPTVATQWLAGHAVNGQFEPLGR